MKHFETKKTQKNAKMYSCESCYYSSSNKTDYDRHLSTRKHKNNVFETLETKKTQKTQKCIQCVCGEVYVSRTSLWRHKKTCSHIQNNLLVEGQTSQAELNNKDIIVMLINDNKELRNMLVQERDEYKRLMVDMLKSGTNVINQTNYNNNCNNNNKSFNLQIFLNETCKNAMNIMEFVDSIKIELGDLEKVGELGYVQGITSIIASNLKALDITQRPIHCTDKKRETLYIKDQNKWEKDDENNNKLRRVIRKVANKNALMIPEFKEKNPDCTKCNSISSDKYNKLIVEAMGGSGDNDLEKEDKIIRNISQQVCIDK
jgi:hypothetical protein